MSKSALGMSTLLFSTSIIAFCSMKKHILPMLISLELSMMGSLIMITASSSEYNKPSTALILITMMACEGALGLGCTVSTTKSKGNEMINSLTI